MSNIHVYTADCSNNNKRILERFFKIFYCVVLLNLAKKRNPIKILFDSRKWD